MQDSELFSLRHTAYGHINSDARAAEAIAADYGLSIDSVRGRLSRSATPRNRLKLAENVAKNPPVKSPSVKAQEAIFARSTRALSLARGVNAHTTVSIAALYDLHYPYTRFDAVELSLQITQDIKPTYFVWGGDMNDNEGLSRWEDERNPYERLFSADYANQDTGEFNIVKAFTDATPGTLHWLLNGNHDQWRYNFWRKHDPQNAEHHIARHMANLEKLGLHPMSSTRQELLRLHSRLGFWHGQFTSSNHQQNGKNTIGQFVEEGQAISLVVGHTHRPAHVTGSSIGYSGVDYWNAPCSSRIDKVPWLDRDPRGWELGMWAGTADDDGVEGANIIFKKKGYALTASYNGHTYSTELKE